MTHPILIQLGFSSPEDVKKALLRIEIEIDTKALAKRLFEKQAQFPDRRPHVSRGFMCVYMRPSEYIEGRIHRAPINHRQFE